MGEIYARMLNSKPVESVCIYRRHERLIRQIETTGGKRLYLKNAYTPPTLNYFFVFWKDKVCLPGIDGGAAGWWIPFHAVSQARNSFAMCTVREKVSTQLYG